MEYSELTRRGKSSFQATLGDVWFRFIDQVGLEDLEGVLITDNAVNYFLDEIKKEKAEYRTWYIESFYPDFEAMQELLLEKEKRMRKRKPTEKQIAFFREFSIQLGLDTKAPGDFLLFERELKMMQLDIKKVKIPTEKQVLFFRELAFQLELSDEIPDDYDVMEKKIDKMLRKIKRNKKEEKKRREPSESQVIYFRELANQLGLTDEIPDNFNTFERKLGKMIENVTKLRKEKEESRKPTEKQIAFFKHLSGKLKKGFEEIPTDYYVFQKKLQAMVDETNRVL